MECLPGFARSPDGLAIARRTAEMVAETREAIRQSQQTIDETREVMRRPDLVIERERVLKRTLLSLTWPARWPYAAPELGSRAGRASAVFAFSSRSFHSIRLPPSLGSFGSFARFG